MSPTILMISSFVTAAWITLVAFRVVDRRAQDGGRRAYIRGTLRRRMRAMLPETKKPETKKLEAPTAEPIAEPDVVAAPTPPAALLTFDPASLTNTQSFTDSH